MGRRVEEEDFTGDERENTPVDSSKYINSNDIANLWPEAASPTPGFHQKDEVENYLHDQVCSGAMSLKDAQTEIATN